MRLSAWRYAYTSPILMLFAPFLVLHDCWIRKFTWQGSASLHILGESSDIWFLVAGDHWDSKLAGHIKAIVCSAELCSFAILGNFEVDRNCHIWQILEAKCCQKWLKCDLRSYRGTVTLLLPNLNNKHRIGNLLNS